MDAAGDRLWSLVVQRVPDIYLQVKHKSIARSEVFRCVMIGQVLRKECPVCAFERLYSIFIPLMSEILTQELGYLRI